MIFFSGSTKKYLAIVFGLVVLTGGVVVFKFNAPAIVNNNQIVVPVVDRPVVTFSEYKLEVSSAVKDFVPNDQTAVAKALDQLIAIRVPREGMAGHLELATALTLYREALQKNNPTAQTLARERLKVFAQTNSWLGLSL